MNEKEELTKAFQILDEWYKKHQPAAREKEMPPEVLEAYNILKKAIKEKKCPGDICKKIFKMSIFESWGKNL